MLAIDTETTGLDLRHGCRPFMVSTLNDSGESKVWSFRVDPFTRTVNVPPEDCEAISQLIEQHEALIFHNSKFDMLGLSLIGVRLPDWSCVHDTILMSHCLQSGGPHDLKSLALRYLDILDDDKKGLHKASVQARAIGKKLGWRIADKGDPHWPGIQSADSSKGMSWVEADMWMPQEVRLREKGGAPDWETLCETYALRDVERTLGLYFCFSEALELEGLTEQYRCRHANLEASFAIENNGITLHRAKAHLIAEKHQAESEKLEARCLWLVDHSINNLDSPKQLQAALFNVLKLPITKRTEKTQAPSTDKDVLESLLDTLREQSKPAWFIRSLQGYRKRSKAAESVHSYIANSFEISEEARFDAGKALSDYIRLHPNFNIPGTDTTRWSSNNPNGQNIAEGKGLPKELGFNLRDLFGPAPGRIWYSLDYSNIEMRIFATQAGEESFIEAFRRGEAVHLLVAAQLYPREWEECLKYGYDFKEVYKDKYQWIKNGNFSLIYGAGQNKADKTYHYPGAYKLIRKQFKQIDAFMRFCYNTAKADGYITTLGGYRLQVPGDGPHKAVNYFVQGSAGWAMCLAVTRVHEYLKSLGPEYKIIMSIHDELVLDFPNDPGMRGRNDMIVRRVAQIMAQSGDDLGLPLPVEANVIRKNWSEEEKLDLRGRIVAPIRQNRSISAAI